MFSLYRRHESECPHREKGIRHTRCTCPVWMDGYGPDGKRRRRSLKTRDWKRAGQILDRIESGTAPAAVDSQSIEKAAQAYLADCRARNLAEGTITSYTKLLDHLREAFPGASIRAIDPPALQRFRAGRKVAPGTQIKEIANLRAFFGYCVDCKWIPDNPASALKPPKETSIPTMPFTAAEITALLSACDRIDNPNQREIPRARLRARALVLLLLYSGFRISDAIKLKRSQVDFETGKLLVRAMKTSFSLYIKLHSDAVEALKALPKESEYFLWSGTSKLSTAIGSARRTVACIVRLSEVAKGHPHRFRDTFSVSLLDAGEDIRTVQLLLGHTSIRTTEKHYAPFVRTTQKRIEDAVSKLHYDLPIPKLPVDSSGDAGGDPKRNVLPFTTKKRSVS